MRVMFVDDEVQVLKGIERMLDSADVDWDVETACSGQQALDAIAENPIDVLVSDMRMPGMGGAELLDEVSRLYPQIVRLILSGQADKDQVYRATAPMHQYLSKPCDAGVLRDTISRACALCELIESTKSHKMLGGISSLPSLPTLYQDVLAEIESPNGKVARIGEIISQDLAMTAKILQLANSAMFGLRTTVSSPAQAAVFLGMDTIKSLVLSVQVFKSFGDAKVDGFSMEALLSHSFRVAIIAKAICNCESLGGDVGAEAFTAGLLHDVGKLILATNAQGEYCSVLLKAKSESRLVTDVEKELLGLSHNEIGGYLLALWGIPQSIVEAVTFHHQPDQLIGQELDSSMIVYVANVLAKEESGTAAEFEIVNCSLLLERVSKADRLEIWRNAISDKKEQKND